AAHLRVLPPFPTRRPSDLWLSTVSYWRPNESTGCCTHRSSGMRAKPSGHSKIGDWPSCGWATGWLTAAWISSSPGTVAGADPRRSEEHTSELQTPDHLVCR